MRCEIITIHHIHNFGSVFQSYALFCFLDKNGYDTELIDYRSPYYDQGKNKLKTAVGKLLNLWDYLVRKKKFENFIKSYDILSKKRVHSLSELEAFYGDKECIYIGREQCVADRC